MAPSSKYPISSKSKHVFEHSAVLSSSDWLRPSITGIVLLILLCLGLDAINQGGISCFFSRHYSLKLVGHIRGTDQPCGDFKVGGVSYVKGGQIAVSDTDHNRQLLFDLKGQFLQVLATPTPIQSTMVTDPGSGLTYTTDWNKNRIVVTDDSGKVHRNIYVRDHPVAVAADPGGTLFVGFGNHYFLQAYSLAGRLKGDCFVENPDPNSSYLDVISLSGTDQGLLLAADPYSVWIYQLPK
jgi:hypothetical protein